MDGKRFASFHNGGSLPFRNCPVLPMREFREAVAGAVGGTEQARLSAFFATGLKTAGRGRRLVALLGRPSNGLLYCTSTPVGRSYPSLTELCPQAHWFEREIREQTGIVPRGHPWPEPIRFQARRRGPGGPDPAVFAPSGEAVHEVAVGPVHAGVIEPGHFRFQCLGERVLHLDISLGYQHRGVEQALSAGPDRRTPFFAETLAGDTSVGHATAHAEAVEALAGAPAPLRGQAVRGIALELERVANHIGDLGALAGDVGFLPTQAYCGRLRGDALNLTALLCGNRFGRGLVRPGGVLWDFDPGRARETVERLRAFRRDAEAAVNLLWQKPSVMGRFTGTGVIDGRRSREMGFSGPAARGSGIPADVRKDFPSGIYRFLHIPTAVLDRGDVFSRAQVRWIELQRSLAFIESLLEALPAGPVRSRARRPRPERLAAALVEGWRGEIAHVVLTGPDGRFARYKVVDPSFQNWFALALCMRGGAISDFPLCNKSFNLSYCGHDL